MHLPLDERPRMAIRLTGSMDDESPELTPARQAEAERRIESIKNGTAKLINHDEAMSGGRKKPARQRSAKPHA